MRAFSQLLIGSHRIVRTAFDVHFDLERGTRLNPEKAAANISESCYKERTWE